MSPGEAAPAAAGPGGRGPDLSAQPVTGHARRASTFLGKVDNPRTGRPDGVGTQAAKAFIDRLGMPRSGTRGDLHAEETLRLTQVVEVVRTASVEVIDAAASGAKDGAFRPGGPAGFR